MDKAIAFAHAERIVYVRCFVEINAGKKLLKHVTIDMEDAESIEFEGVPPICNKCSCFGHVDALCPTKASVATKRGGRCS